MLKSFILAWTPFPQTFPASFLTLNLHSTTFTSRLLSTLFLWFVMLSLLCPSPISKIRKILTDLQGPGKIHPLPWTLSRSDKRMSDIWWVSKDLLPQRSKILSPLFHPYTQSSWLYFTTYSLTTSIVTTWSKSPSISYLEMRPPPNTSPCFHPCPL